MITHLINKRFLIKQYEIYQSLKKFLIVHSKIDSKIKKKNFFAKTVNESEARNQYFKTLTCLETLRCMEIKSQDFRLILQF